MKKNILILDSYYSNPLPNTLIHFLEEYDSVYYVFNSIPIKEEFNNFIELLPYIKSNRINFIKIIKNGKRSIESGLAFLAGKLSTSLPPESHIEIRSDNSVFTNIVHFLKECEIQCDLVTSDMVIKREAKKHEIEDLLIIGLTH